MRRSVRVPMLVVVLLSTAAVVVVEAHSPSVSDDRPATPAQAVVLDDPTLSRAIGATLLEPNEMDWYRMDLHAGDPLVVGMTAPDAVGAVAATFVVVGPGLPPAAEAGTWAATIASVAGAEGAIAFTPTVPPDHEVHAGLGFWNHGRLAIEAPATGSYFVAVFAVDPQSTGKYVLAPGVREEFGVDSVAGFADLASFFLASWPPVASPGLVRESQPPAP